MIGLEREGVRLAGTDFGGAEPPVLLLHDLGGHTGEWNETASSTPARPPADSPAEWRAALEEFLHPPV